MATSRLFRFTGVKHSRYQFSQMNLSNEFDAIIFIRNLHQVDYCLNSLNNDEWIEFHL